MAAQKRIKKEYEKHLTAIQKGTETTGIRFELTNKADEWKGFLPGPLDSLYEAGCFEMRIRFPEKYPMDPPHISFVTPVYHPNVDNYEGEICLDLLEKQNWSPAMSIQQVLLSISSLLTDPNFDDPLNGEARDLWRSSKEKYETKARTSAKQAPKNPLLTKGDGAASAGKKLSKKRSAELEEEKSAKKAKK